MHKGFASKEDLGNTRRTRGEFKMLGERILIWVSSLARNA